MTNNDITQITKVTTTFIIAVLRLSYLHSHLGQNSCSFDLILGPILGKTTLSQLLEQKKTMRTQIEGDN